MLETLDPSAVQLMIGTPVTQITNADAMNVRAPQGG
jgi:hypothetical protein